MKEFLERLVTDGTKRLKQVDYLKDESFEYVDGYRDAAHYFLDMIETYLQDGEA